MIYAVAVFAPLFGSLISGLLGRSIGDRAAEAVSILCMLVAAALGPIACFQLVSGDTETGAMVLSPHGSMLVASTCNGHCATTRCPR